MSWQEAAVWEIIGRHGVVPHDQLPHDYARAIAHHRQNAEACHANDSLMPHAIWQQLRAMYVMNALALEALVERNGGS